jgi:lipopolysaccharide export system protein LptA
MANKSESRNQKVKKFICFSLIIVFSLFAGLSFAQEKKAEPSQAKIVKQQKKDESVPLIITSDTLTADNKAKTALFEGSVVAKKGDMTMFADKMLVHYTDDKGQSNVNKIEADGNVKVIRSDKVIVSKSAVYYSEPEEHIIFTGEPRAMDGDNIVNGTKMTYFLKDERSIVEKSKVFLKGRQPQ